MALNKLEQELLKTLSFYEPMSMELIYLDLDKDFLLANSELTLDDLDSVLKSLVRLKLVKRYKGDNDQILWQRIFPKKSLLRRFTRYFFS